MSFQRIAVVGAGAWGTALANVIARAGRDVSLYARDHASASAIAVSRESPRLAGVCLDDRITVRAIADGLDGSDAVLLVVPAQTLRTVATELAPVIAAGTPLIACAKGIERGSHHFMTEIISACAPAAQPAILSGPSFADDVARGLPTAVTLAAADEALAAELAQSLGSQTFRPYHSTDMRGVEIGGAAKNVLAIAAGIVAGRELGASAAAALVTRGFAELFRFGQAYGARPETLTGLSGLGDLILTCSSAHSRNMSFGIALGRGTATNGVATNKLAEGVFTASALVEMAQARGVEMPIATAVAAVVAGKLSVDDAIEGLLNRPFKAEG